VNENTFFSCWLRSYRIRIPRIAGWNQVVAQLAQFSSLEQEVQMREDLDSIKGSLTNQTSSTSATSSHKETSCYIIFNGAFGTSRMFTAIDVVETISRI